MGLVPVRWLMAKMRPRPHRNVKSFDRELEAAGGLAGRFDTGIKTVPAQKIVGSVGRARNLRSDFFYRTGQKMTDRFVRVGHAMQKGIPLPPLELYKVKRQTPDAASSPPSEYYVVDGHHRVAMARKLGQDFLDAHVVEYRVAGTPAPPAAADPTADGASGQGAAPEGEPPAS